MHNKWTLIKKKYRNKLLFSCFVCCFLSFPCVGDRERRKSLIFSLFSCDFWNNLVTHWNPSRPKLWVVTHRLPTVALEGIIGQNDWYLYQIHIKYIYSWCTYAHNFSRHHWLSEANVHLLSKYLLRKWNTCCHCYLTSKIFFASLYFPVDRKAKMRS